MKLDKVAVQNLLLLKLKLKLRKQKPLLFFFGLLIFGILLWIHLTL